MMFEGPLFIPEDFTGGSRGEGPNLSIPEFKKLRDTKHQEWMSGTIGEPEDEKRMVEALQAHHQWEDLKHHRLAFIAKVLDIEINIRTSKL